MPLVRDVAVRVQVSGRAVPRQSLPPSPNPRASRSTTWRGSLLRTTGRSWSTSWQRDRIVRVQQREPPNGISRVRSRGGDHPSMLAVGGRPGVDRVRGPLVDLGVDVTRPDADLDTSRAARSAVRPFVAMSHLVSGPSQATASSEPTTETIGQEADVRQPADRVRCQRRACLFGARVSYLYRWSGR